MVGFKNRYVVMEVFLDPNKEFVYVEDPITITPSNVIKAIKDSILLKFGECGLASSLLSLQVKYVNPITKLCIIRASREEYPKSLVCNYYGQEHRKLPGDVQLIRPEWCRPPWK